MLCASGRPPPVDSMTWEPWIFWVWNHRSHFSAVLVVRRSFCRLLRPTKIGNPAEERNSRGLLGRWEGLLFPTLGAEIAAVGQFGADVIEILLGLSLCQLLQNTLQVLQFSTGSGQLLCEVFFRGLGFCIFFEVFSGIFLG